MILWFDVAILLRIDILRSAEAINVNFTSNEALKQLMRFQHVQV